MDRKQIIENLALEHRLIVLDSEIKKDTVDQLRGWLMVLMERSPTEEIKLVIDSMGGVLTPSLTFYDFVRTFGINLTGIVNGRCGSSAVVFLLSCKKRVCTQNSRLWIHQVRREFSVFVDEPNDDLRRRMEIELEETLSIAKSLKSILMSRTLQSLDVIQNLIDEGQRFDRYLSSIEAKNLGFVDQIVESFDLFRKGPEPSPDPK